tara:strand:- start:155 stop:421 length:267 start_codon:yes stop_codon:yes gene_type:complete
MNKFFFLCILTLIIVLTLICLKKPNEPFFFQQCFNSDNNSDSFCLFQQRLGKNVFCTASDFVEDEDLYIDSNKILNSSNQYIFSRNNN